MQVLFIFFFTKFEVYHSWLHVTWLSFRSITDFVSIFDNWSSVGMNITFIFILHFYIFYLIKCVWSQCAFYLIRWCMISMCFVFECKIRLYVMDMALVLSHNKYVLDSLKPQHSNLLWIYRICEQHLPVTRYFDYVLEQTTYVCFLLYQLLDLPPNICHPSIVFFLSKKLSE